VPDVYFLTEGGEGRSPSATEASIRCRAAAAITALLLSAAHVIHF
jgi:hypothetical protein